MGRPKALVDDWLVRSLRVLADGGCAGLTVVLGASADAARALLEAAAPGGLPPYDVVVADDWAEGMGASLRAGLLALPVDADAVLLHLVDLPDVGPDVVRRVVATATGRGVLARASYDDGPGHPVLIGADHVSGVVAAAAGDQGARTYLAAHDVTLVPCGDLAGGRDVDARQ